MVLLINKTNRKFISVPHNSIQGASTHH